MHQNSEVHGPCVKALQQLSDISDQVFEHYFSDRTSNGNRKPFFKLQKSVIDLYDFVYRLSTSKPSYQQKMIELFKTALQEHLLKHMPALNQSIASFKLIQTFNLIWDSYMSYLLMLCKRVFPYLNRYYVPANQYQSLQKIGMNVFTGVFFTQNTSKAFLGAYCEDLNKMRKSRMITSNQLYYFSESLAMIAKTQYFSLLKEIYFGESQKFYQQVYDDHSNQQPINYLNIVNNLSFFQQLLQKKSICLIEPEISELFQILNAKLVTQFTDKLLRHPYGFRYFLKNHKTQELRIVNKIFARTEGFQKLRKQLYQFVIEEGLVKLSQKSKASPQTFIKSFYDFYTAFSTLISQGFNKNQQMQISLRNGFEKLISKLQNMIQLLFQFTRIVLDKGSFNTERSMIITIFQQLSYKDQFLYLYRNSLQKKIMNGELVYSIQKQFIQTMNTICGSQSTSQLDKVLQDYIQSTPNNIVPQSLQRQNFNVKVVGLCYWEKKFQNQVTMNLNFAQPLKGMWETFEEVYLSKFPKRKLIILPYQTRLSLVLKFNSKQLAIRCNLVQASIILYLWKTAAQKTKQQQLISGLTLEKSFLNLTLQQIQTLVIETQPGIYRFNWQFASKQQSIDFASKIQQQKKLTKNIQQDRDILIQAAIVKITKRIKQIMFEQLAVQITKRIKLFKPQPVVHLSYYNNTEYKTSSIEVNPERYHRVNLGDDQIYIVIINKPIAIVSYSFIIYFTVCFMLIRYILTCGYKYMHNTILWVYSWICLIIRYLIYLLHATPHSAHSIHCAHHISQLMLGILRATISTLIVNVSASLFTFFYSGCPQMSTASVYVATSCLSSLPISHVYDFHLHARQALLYPELFEHDALCLFFFVVFITKHRCYVCCYGNIIYLFQDATHLNYFVCYGYSCRISSFQVKMQVYCQGMMLCGFFILLKFGQDSSDWPQFLLNKQHIA